MQDLGLCKVQVIAWAKPKLMPAIAPIKSGAGQQILRIMKLTAILVLTACLQVAAKGYSQRITLSVKDAPLEQVFKSIEKQSGFYFNYMHEVIKQAHPVTIQIKDASLDEVLSLCFQGQPLDYAIVNTDKLIIIKERKQLIFSEARQQASPPIDIRGKVIDENGKPVPGVTVSVRGSKKQTLTNENGEFTLSGVQDNAVLSFSSVNMEPFTINVSGQKDIIARLKTKTSELDEVQIVAYGQISKRFQTGNVTSVKATDIEKQPVSNPLLALQGRVPGLFITQANGFPGSAVTVQIQGRNSIGSGNEPLYIIDGVPYPSRMLLTTLGGPLSTFAGEAGGGNPLNYINPSDIESISILKDADATAIYGSRAANGAIIITTKKGKAGKVRTDLNLQNGWGKVTRMLSMLNTQQYLEMRREALKNDGVTNVPSSNYDLNLWDTSRYTDWQKALIGGVANYMNVNAGVSGGSDNIQYLVRGNYHKETTVFPFSKDFSDTKGSFYFNLNSVSNNQKFRFQIAATYLVDRNKLPQEDLTFRALQLAPNAPALYKPDGTLNWEPNAVGASSWTNPMVRKSATYRNITNNIISNGIISYRILNGLDVMTSVGFTNLSTNEFYASPFSAIRPESQPFSIRTSIFANSVINSWVIEPQIDYKRTFLAGSLNALVGITIQQNNNNGQAVIAEGFNSDLLLEDIKSASKIYVHPTKGNVVSNYRYNAGFARVNYNLKEKYIINLTARRDGSSRFGSANRFHNFAAVGAAWIFSNESIVSKRFHFLSFGKLRGSYGTTGNDQIGDYQYLNLYGPTIASVPYQGATGLEPQGLPNPHLKWEETRKLQIGLELGFMNDRLLITGTYIQNRSSNQLLSYVLPSITGFSSINENFPATVENIAWEFTLNSTNVKNKKLTWNTSFNLTVPKNKLVDFPNLESSSYSNSLIVGQPITIQKAYHLLGVNSSSGIYEFIDKDGNVTSNPSSSTDRTVLINTLPKYYGGIDNNFTYKSFTFNFLFQFVKQIGKSYLTNFIPGHFNNGFGNQTVYVLDRWQKADDVRTFQKFSQNTRLFTPHNRAEGSDRNYSDASFIRLKNTSLSWSLPQKHLQKMYLKGLQLYFQGQNLITITKYKGSDPESQSPTQLPPLRIWTFGLKASL
ncbi:SusC/RagA family TonB-linked outer membrane protein [Longitalea arenae]|uniref:SusC/RagA family TonB-linked outer membrane protein n=1 Tax=Longitalea arenae TaxID=2812558 RepID=UPI001967207A|nr:SusC/RagA family TonB-linked outer membrane protein [Longitalea arenae]